MRSVAIVCATCTLLLASCSHQSTRQEQTYAVYSAVLSDVAAKKGTRNLEFVVDDRTTINLSSFSAAGFQKQTGTALDSETIRDFLDANATISHVRKQFDPSLRIKLRSEIPVRDGVKDFWNKFYAAEPDARGLGIVTFSNVGFNQRRDRALVYFGFSGHDLYGGGMVMLLNRSDQVWHVATTMGLWVS